MLKYKTVVTDYEGMARCLDTHAEMGWRLFSVTPDTWRRVSGSADQSDPLEALGGTSGHAAEVYSASYYLIILVREDDHEHETMHLTAAESLERSEITSEGY